MLVSLISGVGTGLGVAGMGRGLTVTSGEGTASATIRGLPSSTDTDAVMSRWSDNAARRNSAADPASVPDSTRCSTIIPAPKAASSLRMDILCTSPRFVVSYEILCVRLRENAAFPGHLSRSMKTGTRRRRDSGRAGELRRRKTERICSAHGRQSLRR